MLRKLCCTEVSTAVHPPTLILSVSMPVLEIRILAFSSLFGWFTPIFLSNRKPGWSTNVKPYRSATDAEPELHPMRSRGLTFVQVGVGEAASQLLDDMDGLQVPGALQPHDGVHSQLGEVVFVVSQKFGGQRGAGDVQQVLLETSCVVAMETRNGDEEEKNIL